MGKIKDAVLAKGLPKRDIKNANRVNLWAFSWMLTLLAIELITTFEWFSSILPFTILFVAHLIASIAMIFAYRHFIGTLDEMERKVQLESLALAAGLTLISFSGWGALNKGGLVPDMDPAALIVVMSLSYVTGLIVGRIRLA